MKKLLILLILTSAAVFSFAAEPARFDNARRYVELGFNLEAGLGNNYFGVNDFFQETLVIDLNQIAKDVAVDGLALNIGGRADTYSNFNFKNFGFGLFTNTDADVYSSIPSSVFELLAEGNTLDKTYTGDLNLRGDVNFETGAWFATKVATPIGKISLKVKSAYFIPIVHIEDPTTSYSLRNNSDGSIVASGSVDIPLYTAIPGSVLENGEDPNAYIGQALASGGLDFAVSADYPLFTFLTVGARIKGLPLFPARMKYRSRMIANYTVAMAPILNDTDAVASGDFVTTTEDTDFYHDEKSIIVFRPFKFGVTAVYKPLGNNLLTLQPTLDLAIFHGVYADIGIKAQTNLANILIFSLSSNLENLMWKQKADLILNARVVELEAAVTAQSQSFVKSFTGAGLNYMIGLRFDTE